MAGLELQRQAHALMQERKHDYLDKPEYSEVEDPSLRLYFLKHLNATYFKQRVYKNPQLYLERPHLVLQATRIPYVCEAP